MPAAIAPPPAVTESRVRLSRISWDTYERLLAELDERSIRLTYDRGELEIMSPSQRHERFKRLIGRIIEEVTLELGIPLMSCGSTTWRQRLQERGLEPDECYYIAHEAQVRGIEEVDLERDPPPDLAVEVEITRSALDRMAIYASLGIPEVWRYDGHSLRVAVLQPDGTYATVDKSPSLPLLTLSVVERFLTESVGRDETAWMREVRNWVRKSLLR